MLDDEDETLNLRIVFKNNKGKSKVRQYSEEWKKEIDSYLSQPYADADEDVLERWNRNETLFPSLSLMARDILSVQATSVAAGRVFSVDP